MDECSEEEDIERRGEQVQQYYTSSDSSRIDHGLKLRKTAACGWPAGRWDSLLEIMSA